MNKPATVTKNWTIFRLAAAALLILCAVIVLIFPGSVYITAAAFIILFVIWLLYYYRLEYSISAGTLRISSGLFFRKHRLLPAENILWELRLSLPPFHRTALMILHTSGGRIVIFGDYSTEG